MATAADRRDQPPLSVRVPGNAPAPGSPALLLDLPPISALFLIDFDVKAGYTIVWKQALPGLELEGIVEYRSLPSGLHTVPEDLIYFVHDGGHAGLSAFINARTDEEEARHARMIAVGVLVPLSYGRLGRAWRHAEALKEMAGKLALDRTQTSLLEEYWEKNRARDTTAPQPFKDTPISSPSLVLKTGQFGPGKGHIRNRSASDGVALLPPGHRLSSLHPAWSLTSLLDTFGPLIFPLHRAALLRKRILISTHAPVHESCNFVYDISILSNIPLSVYDVTDPAVSAQRLRPLFTVGVHDIPILLEHQTASQRAVHNDNDDTTITEDMGSGWVACTTDSILAMKDNLWDMLITMPSSYSVNAKERAWPAIECPKGVPVKATQRDLRRFRSLKLGISRLAALPSVSKNQGNRSPRSTAPSELSAPERSQGIRLSSSSRPGTSTADEGACLRISNEEDTEKIVEPTTWAALAYNGFMWWASAGEQRHGDEVEEQAHDASLLADLAPPMPSPSQSRTSFGPRPSSAGMVDSISSLTARRLDGDGLEAEPEEEEEEARVELAIIAYFHRLTTSILGTLADIVDSSDDDDLLDADITAVTAPDFEDRDEAALLQNGRGRSGDDLAGRWIRVDNEALVHMGLDVWSRSDAEFVRQVTAKYFAKTAYVESKGVDVCGLRVC